MFFRKKQLLDKEQQEQVVAAIQRAEKSTTGEIRIYLESHCPYMDAMDRAKELFASLGMQATVRRNAVLLYMAVKDQQFAILGDEGIHLAAGGQMFWESAAAELKSFLRQGRIAEGLEVCVKEMGRVLKEHFPFEEGTNKNELPDEIVFGK